MQVSKRAARRAEELGVLDRLYEVLEDLQRRLEEDPEGALRTLRREPAVRVAGTTARRLRMGDYRVFY